MRLKLSDRLPIYSFLQTKEIMSKVICLSKADCTHILISSTLVRQGRQGLLRLPSSDEV